MRAQFVVRRLGFPFFRHGAHGRQLGRNRRAECGQRHIRLLTGHRHFDINGAIDRGEHVRVAAAGPEPIDVPNENGGRRASRREIGRPIDTAAQDDRWVPPCDSTLGLDRPRGEWAELERQPRYDLGASCLDSGVRGRWRRRCRYRRQSSSAAAGRCRTGRRGLGAYRPKANARTTTTGTATAVAMRALRRVRVSMAYRYR